MNGTEIAVGRQFCMYCRATGHPGPDEEESLEDSIAVWELV